MTSTTTTRNAFAKLSGQIGGTGPPTFEYLIHDLPSVLGDLSPLSFLPFYTPTIVMIHSFLLSPPLLFSSPNSSIANHSLVVFPFNQLECLLLLDFLLAGRASIDPQDTLMSRQHVELLWCAGKGWQLICLSKNGCTVDKIKYNKDEVASLHDGIIPPMFSTLPHYLCLSATHLLISTSQTTRICHAFWQCTFVFYLAKNR